MAHFLPSEHVRQVNTLEWPKGLPNAVETDILPILNILSPNLKLILIGELNVLMTYTPLTGK